MAQMASVFYYFLVCLIDSHKTVAIFVINGIVIDVGGNIYNTYFYTLFLWSTLSMFYIFWSWLVVDIVENV